MVNVNAIIECRTRQAALKFQEKTTQKLAKVLDDDIIYADQNWVDHANDKHQWSYSFAYEMAKLNKLKFDMADKYVFAEVYLLVEDIFFNENVEKHANNVVWNMCDCNDYDAAHFVREYANYVFAERAKHPQKNEKL